MPPVDGARISGPSRPLPRLLLAAAIVLLVARVALGVWDALHKAPAADLVQWVPIERAQALALASHKPLLYDFNAEWCGPCRTMKDEVFSDPDLARHINDAFIPVSVVDRSREDGRNVPAVEALQKRFAVNSFPTLVIEIPGRYQHESLIGYRGINGTMHWLQQTPLVLRGRGRGEDGGGGSGGAVPDSVITLP
jgi:thiol:disulfide interchange protein